MSIIKQPKLKQDSFHLFPTSTALTDFSLKSSEICGSIDTKETQIETPDDLFNLAQQILKEDTVLIWFRGTNAIAMLGAGDRDFSRLDKFADLAVIQRTVAQVQSSNLQCIILPVEFLHSNPFQLKDTIPIAALKCQDAPEVPKYKAMFNKYVAGGLDNCMLTLAKDAAGAVTVTDRLIWSSKKSAYGFILNDTKEIWQISIIGRDIATVIGIADKHVGAVITKPLAAKLYKLSHITRYFQAHPDSVTLSTMQQTHGDPATVTVALHREAGHMAYKLIDSGGFLL